MKDLHPGEVAAALRVIKGEVDRLQCHCRAGTALSSGGGWHNAVAVFSHEAGHQPYLKMKAGSPENRFFTAGNSGQQPVYTLQGVKVGVNICREIVFPGIWSGLQKQGAQIVFHINNAIKPKDKVWRHLLITRAIENDFFVCSVSHCHPPQELASCVVAPSGRILAEAGIQQAATLAHEIDLRDPALRIDF